MDIRESQHCKFRRTPIHLAHAIILLMKALEARKERQSVLTHSFAAPELESKALFFTSCFRAALLVSLYLLFLFFNSPGSTASLVLCDLFGCHSLGNRALLLKNRVTASG